MKQSENVTDNDGNAPPGIGFGLLFVAPVWTAIFELFA
jgi:hypothetical protein